MKKLTIDMETRSRIDLKKQGLYRYAEDESTSITCIAAKISGGAPRIWLPDYWLKKLPEGHGLPLLDLAGLVNAMFSPKIDLIEAHNAAFEMALWAAKIERMGLNFKLPFDKMRCSAAKAAYYALPRALDEAGKALNLEIQKDPVGKAIMLKMCKPRKPTKIEKQQLMTNVDVDEHDPYTFVHDGTGETINFWHEDPEDLVKLCRYCIRDVESEEALSDALPEIPTKELESWRLDYKINTRGLAVDLPGINNVIKKVKDSENKLLLEIQTITEGFVHSARQVDNLHRWIERQGIVLEDLTKDTVITTLKSDLPPKVKRVLEIRQLLAKSSVAKLQAMKDYSCSDGRMRGLFMWHGATTGRFTGKGPQLQNFPRDSYKDKDIETVLNSSVDDIEFMYDPIMTSASKCLRGMVTASPGKVLIAADFEQVEYRVLAWLAGEEKVLKMLQEKEAMIYERTAADIYKKNYKEITKEERQIGKVCNLALGYAGWTGALVAMAKGYNMVLPDEDECTRIMTEWRSSRPATVRFWNLLDEAAKKTIQTGKPHAVGKIKFGIQHGFLRMLLPSGRMLSYYQPQIETKLDQYKREKEVVTYMAYKPKTKFGPPVWHRTHTYGGKWAENATQAVAYDLLMEAMKRVESHNLPIVLHVHDEIVCEIDEVYCKGKNLLTAFEEDVAFLPSWASGLPITASGWIGKRYRK